MELREKICSVDYELCGSELVALLMESAEIKKHLPIYNRAQRRTNFQWGIFEDTDAQGYRSLMVYKTSERNDVPLNVFTSKLSAISDLERWTELHGLCQKINGLYQSAGACFHYGIKQCQGACIGEESAESYNLRVDSLLNIFQYENANMLIIEPGRTDDEKSLVLIESNVYRGFGFVSVDELSQSVDVIKSFVKPYTDNKDVAAIIRGFLRHKSPEALITF
jgi:DNA polymerase-3 subunit epsilon